MADLSPVAQAVLDAADDAFSEQVSLLEESPISTRAMSFTVAAALRAAADQVVNPDDHEPACVFEKDYWDYGFSAAVETIRGALLSIAAELEGADG